MFIEQKTHAKRFDFELEPGSKILITRKPNRYNWDSDMNEFRGQWLTVIYTGVYTPGDSENDTDHYFIVEEDGGDYYWDPQHIDAVMKDISFIPGNLRGDPQLPML